MPENGNIEMSSRESKFGPQEPGVPRINSGKNFPGAVEASAGGGAGGGSVDWENRLKVAQILDESEAYELALEAAEGALREAMDLADVGEYQKIQAAIKVMKAKLGTTTSPDEARVAAEARRQMEYLLNLMNFGGDRRKQQTAAQRWLSAFSGKGGVTAEMLGDVQGVLTEDPGKALEIEPSVDMKLEIRMAMIRDLGVSTSGDPGQKCEQFIRQQVTRFGGMGKTHFSADYEKDLKMEYLARAELAAVVGFWDDLASVTSKGTDVWKEMTEARIDRCVKLSKSTYEWLADGGKRMGYKSETGLERSNGKEVEQRKEMNQVSSVIYAKMIAGELDIWNTRGEDRWSMIGQIASELNVSTDAVRLTWQLAEAEVWAARMKVGFISHPAGRVVVASEFRDFRTRKGLPVPGGSRLWSEHLRLNENVYPTDKDIYDEEGRRLARVGFEAWVVRVTDKKDNKGRYVDQRFEQNDKYRSGVVNLFLEKGGVPGPDSPLVDQRLLTVNLNDRAVRLTMMVDGPSFEVGLRNVLTKIDVDNRDKVEATMRGSAVGGERALVAGTYFTGLEALLSQPGLLDVDLPQTVTMADLSKASSVYDAIEALGKVDATKATTKELADLKNALTSQLFRFQSNDLVHRVGPEGKDDMRKITLMDISEDLKKRSRSERKIRRAINEYWKISNGASERTTKARIRAGELMEEWARSYVWLMSWDNPANKSEEKVMAMADWIKLARSVAMEYDRSRQWGEAVGYGYGPCDDNELAVDEKGATRGGPTENSKLAAKRYVRWFEWTFGAVSGVVSGNKGVMTGDRRNQERGEKGTYGPDLVFWKGRWW